jgi:hypothetical protein
MMSLGLTVVITTALLAMAVVTAGMPGLEVSLEPDFFLSFEVPMLIAVVTGFLFQVAFFWRYRLPICFALIAISVLGVLWMLAQFLFGAEAISENMTTVFATSGLLLLALAVAVDAKDPLRRNGWAECAFWLYVMGAPATVHSIMSAIGAGSMLTLIVIAVAVLVSLVLDRRSLIVSSLIYIAIMVGETFKSVEIEGAAAFAVACIVVGAVVLGLGFGWRRARGWIMGYLDSQTWRRYLPPA